MTTAIRYAAILALAFVAGACVRVGHIQQTQPVRTLQFTGSAAYVAKCVHTRLGGKIQDASFGDRIVIYNSAKGQSREGLTHYSITIDQLAKDYGLAEWRIMTPPSDGTPASNRGSPQLSESAVRQYWGPVEECAAQAKPAS
jgi:hypothetical protein